MKHLIRTSVALCVLSSPYIHAQDVEAEGDIVVTGSLVEQTIPEAPASISVVNKKEFEKRPIQDVSDALQFSEGVSLSPDDNRGISLRGLDPAYTLILVNGKRVNSRQLTIRNNNDTDLSWISPSEIQRVEVVRGPMATLYGADAMGGVVNIITKKVKDDWRSYVNATYTGSEDSRQGNSNQINIGTSGSLSEKLKLKVNARRAERERPEYTDDARNFSGIEKRFVSGELDYQVSDKHRLNFSTQYSVDDQESLGRRGTVAPLQTKRQYYSLDHEMKTENLTWTNRVYSEQYKYDSSGDLSELGAVIADSTTKFSLFDSHFVVAGVEYRDYSLDFISTTPTNSDGTSESSSTHQYALFVEDAYTLTDKATLTVGVRNTNHSRYDNHFTPRAYLNYAVTNDLMIKTGVGTGFKAPGILQMSNNFTLPSCQGSCTVVGNPDLDPETNTSYELGATLTKKNWGANITFFHTEIKDMINTYFATIDGERFRYYRNIDEAMTQGIEFGAHYNLNDALTTKINLTYTDSEDKSTGDTILGIPVIVSNLLVDYSFNDAHSAYTAINYFGEVDRESDGERFATTGYTTYNFGYSYLLKLFAGKHKVRATVGVENAFDKTLDNTYGFGIMGRRYFAKLAYNF